MRFHQSQKKIRLISGGNRSGKSTSGVVEDIWHAAGIHPFKKVSVPNKIWICGSDFPHGVAGVLVPKLKSLLPKEWIRKITRNANGVEATFELNTGSIIELKSFDQDVSKFESADSKT